MTETSKIQTSILTFEHTEHGNRLDLVGIIHVAEPQYYEAIQNFVDERSAQGAVVHYEAMKTLSKEEFDQLSPQLQRKTRSIVTAVKFIHGSLQEIDGVISQGEGLTYYPEWKNQDRTLIEQAAEMSRLSVVQLQLGAGLLRFVSRILPKQETQAMFLESLLEQVNKPEANLLEKVMIGGLFKHVESGRNQFALNALDEELQVAPDRDVVLLWGEGHLHGLKQGVQKRGFSPTQEQSITAITFNTY